MQTDNKIQIFKRFEISLFSDKEYANPFTDVDIDAIFTSENGVRISLPGFWNGENEWKVRFSPNSVGKWTYAIYCTDKDNKALEAKGELECVDAPRKTELEKHGYVQLERANRYFTYADGKPFFYLGDTHWQMPDFERLDECNYPGCTCGNQFRHLADDRIKKGFTVYQTYFDSAESDGGGNKRRYHWWKEKYSLINPQAFNDTMDKMIEYLADNGITTAMGFGVHCSTPRAMNYEAEPLLRFARYCVARYACYPVMWITAQEISNLAGNEKVTAFDIWQKVGALVGELDGYHRPNGAHQHVHPADSERSKVIESQPWHQWWTLQAGHGGVKMLQPRQFYQGYYELPSKKPILETECHYEDIYCSGFCGSEASRIGAWNAIQSGCCGFTYGVTGVWAMRWNQDTDCGWSAYSPEPWYIGMNKPGSDEMTHLKKFYEYVGFERLTPSFGFEFASFEMRAFATISHYKKDIFVFYFSNEIDETGDIINLKKDVEYQARWYDPIHGIFLDIPSIKTTDGTYKVPERPTKRDWVLLLNDIDLGEYESGTYPEFIPTMNPRTVTPGEEIPVLSIIASSEEKNHPAANACDGNEETYWCGAEPCTSQTLTVEFDKSQEIGWFYITTKMKTPIYIKYRVYGSDDGESYNLISERPLSTGVAFGGNYYDFYDIVNYKCKYLRIFFNSLPVGTPKLELTKLAFYKSKQ